MGSPVLKKVKVDSEDMIVMDDPNNPGAVVPATTTDGRQATLPADLTDSTGGTADTTLDDMPAVAASDNDADGAKLADVNALGAAVDDNFASVAAQIKAISDALKAAGLGV